MFDSTFRGCSGLSSIPQDLFSGISGTPTNYIFKSTFYDCSGLTNIPENLFSGISGSPAEGMYKETFTNCKGLASIPENLFSTISGAPKTYMFDSTFSGCSNLTGPIPAKLFAGISGSPKRYMFQATFKDCSKLTGYIPATLFSGIAVSTLTEQMINVFNGTNLATSCPAGTETYTTGFESYFDGHVACIPNATEITITWDLNDGTSTTTSSTCNLDSTFDLPPAPTRVGYIFTGWKVNNIAE